MVWLACAQCLRWCLINSGTYSSHTTGQGVESPSLPFWLIWERCPININWVNDCFLRKTPPARLGIPQGCSLVSPGIRQSLASVFLSPCKRCFILGCHLLKKTLKQLILCRFAVRNIFAYHRAAITIKPPKHTESTDCRFETSLVTLKSV